MRPADEPADRIDQAVEAGGEDEAGDAQERSRRHVVAGDRKAVLEAGDAAAGGIEVGRRTGSVGRPLGDAERQGDEDEEHHDGRDIERLTSAAFDRAGGQALGGAGGDGEEAGRGENDGERAHHFTFSLI